MKMHFNTFVRSLTLCGAVLLCCTSCGGGGGSSSGAISTGNKGGGLAPEKLHGDMILVPTDANVRGIITLTDTPAQVAYFNSREGTNGAYTGNYHYTKVGANMVHLQMDNVRYEPINTADDCYWTIDGYMVFVDAETVVFKGTETLVGSTGHHGDTEHGEGESEYPSNDATSAGNHPIDFGGTDVNHFSEIIHDGGGTRNFQYNYKIQKNN